MKRIQSVAIAARPMQSIMVAAAMAVSTFAAPLFVKPVHAQTQPPAPPQIVVSANGEVNVTPDRANIQLGVETEAKTAALASVDNNKKQTAVLAAIKALGIPASSITTSSFNVMPIQSWNDVTKKTVVTGYRVSNTVVVNVSKIEQTGAVIDVALANGANRVAGLTFESSDPSKAREEAITKAVAQARREAEVAAKAAGGSIEGMLEININSYEPPRPMPVYAMAKMASADAVATPVSEGTLTVQVNVTTRWRFVARN